MIGTTEIMIIGGVIVLLFGAEKLPELARSIGSAKKEFTAGLKEESKPETTKE